MRKAKTKVLIVDDSSFMRLVIRDMLQAEPGIEVMDTASNGKEAWEKTVELKPDVVVLDMVMEEYDGLYAIREIMERQPTPIIVLSAAAQSDRQVVFDALELGALDFLDKPDKGKNSRIRDVGRELCNKILDIDGLAERKLQKAKQRKENHATHTFGNNLPYQIIVIGASTGGPGAVEAFLMKLPANLPLPVVVVQHMPENFVLPFTTRLNNILPLEVKVAKEGALLERNTIHVCTSAYNLVLAHENGRQLFKRDRGVRKAYNNPSIDAVMESAAELFGSKTIGLVLSGMGTDGTEGLLAIKAAKGLTLAQDEQSAIIYGMPKSAKESGAAQYVMPDKEMPGFIISNF